MSAGLVASLGRLPGPLLPGLALVAYSHDAVFSRLAVADPFVVTAGRFAVAALVLWPLVLARQSAALRGLSTHAFLVTALAGLLLAVDFASWVAATHLTTLANSLLLTHVAPVWAVLLTVVLFRKHPTRGDLAVIGLSIVGTSIIAQGSRLAGSASAITGDLLAIASSLPSAAFLILSAAFLNRLPMLLYGALAMSWATLFCAGAAVLSGDGLPTQGTVIAAIVGMGLVAQLLGHGGLTWCLHWRSPCFVAVLCLLEPLLGTLWGFLYFGEPLGPWTALGGVLVLFAIWLGARHGEPAAESILSPRVRVAAGS